MYALGMKPAAERDNMTCNLFRHETWNLLRCPSIRATVLVLLSPNSLLTPRGEGRPIPFTNPSPNARPKDVLALGWIENLKQYNCGRAYSVGLLS